MLAIFDKKCFLSKFKILIHTNNTERWHKCLLCKCKHNDTETRLSDTASGSLAQNFDKMIFHGQNIICFVPIMKYLVKWMLVTIRNLQKVLSPWLPGLFFTYHMKTFSKEKLMSNSLNINFKNKTLYLCWFNFRSALPSKKRSFFSYLDYAKLSWGCMLCKI